MKLLLLYRRRWGLFYLPILALAILVVWWAARYAMPLPPRSLVMAVGSTGGSTMQMARRYRDQLERQGIQLEVVASDNARAALQRLASPDGGVQAGFAPGLASHTVPDSLQTLAVVGMQPVWIFTRLPTLAQLGQLRGLAIASTGPGTPARDATLLLLAQAQLRPGDVRLEAMEPPRAAAALQDGAVDVVVVVAGDESPTVRLLSRAAGIQILGLERVNALAAREPRLRPFVLPQGSIELRGDIPPRDLTMVATMTHLLVQGDMHPALQRALIDAAQEIHEGAGFLRRHGEFPQLRGADIAFSPVARTMALGERPWLERLLPYRLAQLAAVLLYAVLPVLLATWLLLRWIPGLFAWRVNAVLQNYYGELKFLEAEIEPTAANRPLELRNLLTRLDAIEQQVAALDLPDRFADRWYTLREHLAAARDKLFELRAR